MMEKTWRWFGRKDKITLDMLRQIGVEGIVTALHDVPNGEIWTLEKILDLKQYIESFGLRWSVVESLPVCESIKYGGPDRDELIEKYKISLANLGRAGVHSKQALVLVNRGGATGGEVLELCRVVCRDVHERFGIEIKPEVNIV